MLRTSVPRFVVERAKSVAVMPSPYQQAARGSIVAAAQEAYEAAGDSRCPKPVQPIHDAAVPWNDLACVLCIEPPLHPGLEQIAQLRNCRKEKRKNADRDF